MPDDDGLGEVEKAKSDELELPDEPREPKVREELERRFPVPVSSAQLPRVRAVTMKPALARGPLLWHSCSEQPAEG